MVHRIWMTRWYTNVNKKSYSKKSDKYCLRLYWHSSYTDPGIPTTMKTMGVNITTIAYLRVLIIEIGSTIILMVVEAQGTGIRLILIYVYALIPWKILLGKVSTSFANAFRAQCAGAIWDEQNNTQTHSLKLTYLKIVWWKITSFCESHCFILYHK